MKMKKMSPVMKAKLKKEEIKEKKMPPMMYAKMEKREPMRKEAMESMAEKKSKMTMKPSMMANRRRGMM